MSDPDKRSEIERLLAEADAVLGGAPPAAVGRQADVEPTASRLSQTLPVAVLAGAGAAAVIFGVFTLLPLLGAPSGAVAAFLATFVTVIVLRRR